LSDQTIVDDRFYLKSESPQNRNMSEYSYTPRIFHFVGLDLILTRDGKWVLIEVNDHPVGLVEADRLSQQVKGTPVFSGNGVNALVNTLATHARGQAVCLLLPDCFRVQTKTHTTRAVSMNGGEVYDDNRIGWTLDSFNLFGELIRSLGTDCLISDVQGVHISGKDVIADPQVRIGTLFRRANSFPREEVQCFCVNDMRLRMLCADKLQAHAVLSAAIANDHLVRTLPLRSKEARELLETFSNEESVIFKPKWGSASIGVKRLLVSEAKRWLSSEATGLRDHVWQKWIEPATVSNAGRSYYFDVRVYVVAGKPVAGFARRSAAPMSETHADNPLSWLTTTGMWLPLIKGHSRHSESCVRLTNQQTTELFHLSVSATRALDKAGTEINYREALRRLPNFSSLIGAKGKLKLINLQDASERAKRKKRR
jgi:hypothetical protein